MDKKTTLLRVIGRVKNERSFSLDELLSMDMVDTQENLLHACGDGEIKGSIPVCRGILLTDIINKAGVVVTGHNDTRKMYIALKLLSGNLNLKIV